MKFQKAIITSGPTREWIDPVRYISNASSGKMGYCIAEAIRELIPNTIYIRGLVDKEYENPQGCEIVSVDSTEEMKEAVLSNLQENCILIMAAAPADFRPAHAAEQKIKKEEGKDRVVLELEKNPDILKECGHFRVKKALQNTLLVGFSAETEKLEENARKKLSAKGIDWIVGNYVGRNDKGFGNVESSLILFGSQSEKIEIGPASKERLAQKLIESLPLG